MFKRLFKKEKKVNSNKGIDPCTKKLQQYVKEDPNFKYPERGIVTEYLDEIHDYKLVFKNNIDDINAYLRGRVDIIQKAYPHHTNTQIEIKNNPHNAYLNINFYGDRLMNDEEYEKAKEAYLQKWEEFQKMKLQFNQ